MKPKLFLTVAAFLAASLVLGACTLPLFGTSGYNIILSNPAAGAVYPVGAAITLRGGVNYSATLPAVAQLTFWASGTQVGSTRDLHLSTTDSGDSNAFGSYSWTPSAPGEYLIQAMATMGSGRIAISTTHRICVVDIALPATWAGGSGYTGPCPLPPPPALHLSDTSFSMTASASPSSISFEGVPPLANCPPEVSFTADLHDPSGRAALVEVAYDAVDPSGAGGGDTLVLNPTSAAPIPYEVFTGSVPEPELEAALSGNLVDGSGNSISGNLEWTAKAFDRSGAVLATVGPNDIPASPCAGNLGLTPHVIQPIAPDTPTPTDTPTATATATPAANCPKGTMNIPSLGNGCYYVTRTPKPKGTVAAACFTYHNPSACTSNGCSWDKGTSTCH